jgi:predicted metal-binding protein
VALGRSAPVGVIRGVPTEPTPPRLHVCVTCRAGEALAEGEAPPGARLHDAIAALLGPEPKLRLAPVACLANCERGCSAAISAPGKWTYLLGHLAPAHAADLLTYASAYAASRNGTVLPSRRPASLHAMVVGRVPAPELLA